MFSENRFQHDGLRLNYAAGPPAGEPLVLLHGVVRCWQTFLPLLPALATRRRIYALDFPGHGLSDRAEHEYRVVDYVDHALAFVQSLNAPVALYGHSLGAMAAAAVAARAQDQVRAVVLEDPPFETMGRRMLDSLLLEYFQTLQRFAGDPRDAGAIRRELGRDGSNRARRAPAVPLSTLRDAATLRFMAACLRRLDPRVLPVVLAGRWLEGYDAAAIATAVRCPALLLQADAACGGMLRDDDAESFLSLAPDACRLRIAGVGHSLHSGATQSVLNAVWGFLESI